MHGKYSNLLWLVNYYLFQRNLNMWDLHVTVTIRMKLCLFTLLTIRWPMSFLTKLLIHHLLSVVHDLLSVQQSRNLKYEANIRVPDRWIIPWINCIGWQLDNQKYNAGKSARVKFTWKFSCKFHVNCFFFMWFSYIIYLYFSHELILQEKYHLTHGDFAHVYRR